MAVLPDLKRYYILLALAEGALHGLGIDEQIQSDSRSTMYLRSGSLYRLLREMEQRGYIEPAGDVPGHGGRDGLRKLYRLTLSGQRVLKSDAHTLEEAGRLGRLRLP